MLTSLHTEGGSALRYCNVCGCSHPATDFYTYGGSGPSANRLRTYCKAAQVRLNAERCKKPLLSSTNAQRP